MDIKHINGYKLYIEDNGFSRAFQERFYTYASMANNYQLGFNDTTAVERYRHTYYTANIDGQGLAETKLFDELYKTEIGSLIKGKQLYRATINSSTASQVNFAHTHKDQMSLLYYINLDWKPEWGGETLFYNDTVDEIEFASIYKPNRLMLFDGEIPHSLRCQSSTGPEYRFSLAMFFDK